MADSKKNIGNGDAGSVIRAVLLISAVIMTVIFIMGGIYLAGLLGKSNEKSEDPPENNKYPSDLLIKETYNNEFEEELPLSDITLKEAFLLYDIRISYYQECTVTTGDADDNSTTLGKRILREGDKFNIRTYNQNSLIETIKCDGENILIINEITGNSTLVSSREHSVYQLAGLPDHEYIMYLVKEFEESEDKTTTTLSDLKCSLSRERDVNSLTLSLTYGETDLEETYHYNLDDGVIFEVSSSLTLSGKTSSPYSLESTYFKTDISDFLAQDSFVINN